MRRKRKCKCCGKREYIYARNTCYSCYRKQVSIEKKVSGRRVKVTIPFGDRAKAERYYEETKKMMLKDLYANPGKWLDKIK